LRIKSDFFPWIPAVVSCAGVRAEAAIIIFVRKIRQASVNGRMTINQPNARVNRNEVVCLHSRTTVLSAESIIYCLVFQTNRKGGCEENEWRLVIFFYFSLLGSKFSVAQNLFKRAMLAEA
jgi:hypothetical protein